MKAKTVAEKLKAQGIAVLNYTEGDEWEDGEVIITELVHVQVPTFGARPGVVRENADETFTFYPARKDIEQLKADIGDALARAAA